MTNESTERYEELLEAEMADPFDKWEQHKQDVLAEESADAHLKRLGINHDALHASTAKIMREVEKAERIEFYWKCFAGGYLLGLVLAVARYLKRR